MPAKKYTKAELKEAVTKWMDETGLPAEDRPALLKTLDHDGMAAKLGESILMRQDYSRASDETTAERVKYTKAHKEVVEDFYPKAKAAKEAADARAEAAEKKIKRFIAEFGDLDEAEDIGGGRVRTESGDVIRKADFDKILAEREKQIREQVTGQAVGIQLEIQDLAYDHFTAFNKPLDTRPLVAAVKAARDRGDTEYSLQSAYDEQWGPKLEEQKEAADKKRIDDAVTAARLDERSKHRASPAAVIDEDNVGPFAAQNFVANKPKQMSPEELEADWSRGSEGATATQ